MALSDASLVAAAFGFATFIGKSTCCLCFIHSMNSSVGVWCV